MDSHIHVFPVDAVVFGRVGSFEVDEPEAEIIDLDFPGVKDGSHLFFHLFFLGGGREKVFNIAAFRPGDKGE